MNLEGEESTSWLRMRSAWSPANAAADGRMVEQVHCGSEGPVMDKTPHPNTPSEEHQHMRPAQSPPTLHPAALRTQVPGSLLRHLVKDHPVKAACLLPFPHGPFQSVLQRHGGLPAGQGPEHWAIKPQGQSWLKCGLHASDPPSSVVHMCPTQED